DQRCDHLASEAVRCADPQLSARRTLAQVAHLVERAQDPLDAGAAVLVEQFALACDRCGARRAPEQAGAELVLEFPYAAADRGTTDTKPIRGAREAALVGHGDEGDDAGVAGRKTGRQQVGLAGSISRHRGDRHGSLAISFSTNQRLSARPFARNPGKGQSPAPRSGVLALRRITRRPWRIESIEKAPGPSRTIAMQAPMWPASRSSCCTWPGIARAPASDNARSTAADRLASPITSSSASSAADRWKNCAPGSPAARTIATPKAAAPRHTRTSSRATPGTPSG